MLSLNFFSGSVCLKTRVMVEQPLGNTNKTQINFPLLSSKPVRLDAVRSLTAYVYS